MFELLKAIADANRLRLLGLLVQGEFTVQELTAILAMGQSRISHHLKVLSGVGLVSVKREGTWGYYYCERTTEGLSGLWPVISAALSEFPEHQEDLMRLGAALEMRRKKSREFFDRHSGDWDELNRKLLPTVAYQEELLRLLPEATVLVEVGIGTGSLLPQLSAKARQVVGVDHSPPMLDEARGKITFNRLGNVDLRLGDMAHLPVADGAADVILLNMVLHHAPDPVEVFAESRRVLRSGGTLVIADLQRHKEDWVRQGLADQWLGFERSRLEGWLAESGFGPGRFQEIEGKGGRLGVIILSAPKSE